MTPAEYLAWEREQPEKHEHHHGEIFAMAGGSPRHAGLAGAMIAELVPALRSRGCRVLTSDQRVSLEGGQRHVYPDVSVVCGSFASDSQAEDVLTNPTILVEVLSKSTASYDRGEKWEAYQRLPSLTDYLLVSQIAARIEHFRRAANGAWMYSAASAGEHITLSNGATIEVDAVYTGVFELPGD